MRCRVYVTPHALRQWRNRVNPGDSVERIAKIVRGRLKHQIRVGMKANSRGAFELELMPRLTAIMVIDGRGWVLITVIYSGSNQNRLPG